MPYLTNETVFEARERPKHLIIIGGGPIGLELAQAFRRLGAEVTVLEAAQPLAKEDPECAAVVLDRLAREGVVVRSGVKVARVERVRARVEVVLGGAAGRGDHRGQRSPDRDRPAARCRRARSRRGRHRHDARGIAVDAAAHHQPRVYAIGDVAGGAQFTHAANYHAGLVIRHALFRLPVKVDASRDPARHLHRSGAGPCRPDRSEARGGSARRSACCAGPITRTTAPRPSARPAATSRSSPTRRAASSARPSSARRPAN